MYLCTLYGHYENVLAKAKPFKEVAWTVLPPIARGMTNVRAFTQIEFIFQGRSQPLGYECIGQLGEAIRVNCHVT